jgi:hypothetical protein
VEGRDQEPPYDGGSQPVEERPTGIEGTGRGGVQIVVLVLGAIVLIAAAAWLLVPLLGNR